MRQACLFARLSHIHGHYYDGVLYMRKHTRKSIRYPGWDYRTPGYYFVTICAHDRHTNHAFGQVQEKDETAWVALRRLGSW